MEGTRLDASIERLAASLGVLPEPVDRPVLVVVSGLPGTGKSHFCARLAERVPFAVLGSDALRKVLFSRPTYSTEESATLFAAIHRLIERLLAKGVRVILDATNLLEQHREPLYGIAARLGIKLLLVQVEAPPEVVYERMQRRQREADSRSDADWAVYQKMKGSVEKIRRPHYVVDTSQDITPVLDEIVREVSASQ